MTMVAAAGMLFVTSCVKDAAADIASTGDDVTVTFALDTANGIATRVISDGTSVDVLSFDILSNGTSIFNTENPKPTTSDFVNFAKDGQPYTLSVSLIKGQSYTFVFWAQNSGCKAYTVDEDKWTVSVDYSDSSLTNNLEASDAFYATGEITVSASSVQQVTLRRPFAQLNVGITAEDFNAAEALGLVIKTSSVELTGVADEIDLLTGEVTGSKTIELAAAAIPTEKLTVGGEEYHYLSMSYILAAEKATVGAAYEFEGSVKVSLSEGLSSVPVQRNWRTNIIGRLLTGTIDFEIVVDGDFYDNHNVELEWDGKSVNTPKTDEEGNYHVTRPSELAGLAQLVNGGDELEGATVYIDGDIDLGGHEFPGIAAGATRDGKNMIGTAFKGTLDGQGHTISNLVVTDGDADKANEAVGFLGSLTGEFKDMTFENVQIDTKSKQAGIVGVVSEGGKISGVKVKSGTISGAQAVGGIAGRLILDGTIENCENHANIESQASNAGGIVGAAYYTEEGKTMTISGCDNYGTVSGKSNAIGGIVGLNCGEVSNCNNYGTSVTGAAASVGGIVGEQKAAGSVKDCVNYADVAGGPNYGAGGIVGWVRYAPANNADYPAQSPVTVSGCTNEAKHISGVSGVGGIVGMWYCDGICTENTSFAETITASDKFVAGIVGGSQWTEYDSNGNNKDNFTEGLVLSVTKNTSYTSIDNITGGSKASIIYINNRERTDEHDNTNPQVTEASSDEELADAVKEANAYIKLAAGEYKLPSGVAEGVTFVGEGANFIIGSSQPGRYTNVTFKNVTITGSQNYTGMQHSKNLKFEYCKLNGLQFLYADNCEFNNCVFNQETKGVYCVWTYTATPVYFTDCKFYCVGRAVNVFNEGGISDQELYFKNCNFHASVSDGKSVLEIGTDSHNVVVHIDNCTEEGFVEGSVNKNTLWNHKSGSNKLVVYVDGEQVYNYE